MVKRYFPVINKTRIRLPQEFINSTNKKFIHVINFSVFRKYESMSYSSSGYISLHSNLVQSNPYNDHFIRFSDGIKNVIDRLKYEQIDNIEFLEFWFKYPDGKKIGVKDKADTITKTITMTDPDSGEQKEIKQTIETGERSIIIDYDSKDYYSIMLMLEY